MDTYACNAMTNAVTHHQSKHQSVTRHVQGRTGHVELHAWITSVFSGRAANVWCRTDGCCSCKCMQREANSEMDTYACNAMTHYIQQPPPFNRNGGPPMQSNIHPTWQKCWLLGRFLLGQSIPGHIYLNVWTREIWWTSCVRLVDVLTWSQMLPVMSLGRNEKRM